VQAQNAQPLQPDGGGGCAAACLTAARVQGGSSIRCTW
jgi:hypothetical protein